jgi:RNA polymerase sigma-32 factor
VKILRRWRLAPQTFRALARDCGLEASHGTGTGSALRLPSRVEHMTTSETSLTPALRRAARVTPLLSASEEQRLARAARDGDQRALDKLLRAHFRLVLSIAQERGRRGAALEDCIGEGLVGLTEAARRFDPERGLRFAPYAALWIRAYVRRFSLQSRRVVRMPQTRGARTVLAHLGTTRARLERETGRRATRAEVAIALNVPERDVEDVETSLRGHDVPHGVEVNGHVLDLPSLAPSPEDVVAETLERQAGVDRIQRALRHLSDRDRLILQRRSLSEDSKTLVEIGRELGISNERVRQLEARAKATLRCQLLADVA